MQFRLLGPLEADDHERSLALGGIKQRSLLAVLLLRANEIVPVDRLIEELWGETPPATAAKSVQIYVSRLRKELGYERLATRAPGYILNVDPSELDLTRFEQLVAQARRADPATAARKLREGLALWRGPPLGDLAYEPFAQPEIARLDELRVTTLEARVDADLASGRHAELVAELEALVAAHPLRERLRGQLMLALYRSGRQAEALHAYRAARDELAEQLGLNPGEDLRALERAILEHDPKLALAAEPARPAVGAPERSLLVFPTALGGLDALLRVAAPLAASEAAMELLIAVVVPATDVGEATAALAARGDELRREGLTVRSAAFASPTPAADIARLAAQERVELVLMEASPRNASMLEGETGVLLKEAPCDIALSIAAGDPLRDGPVIVPFGAAHHDWAALELGTWAARASGAPLRLIGAASDDRADGRDASRLLADASLIVQRRAGVVAEPLLTAPGREGIMALAKAAGLLVVGLSDRWRDEGLGSTRTRLVEAPPAPTLLVRRGDQHAPADTRTRFAWSLTAS